MDEDQFKCSGGEWQCPKVYTTKNVNNYNQHLLTLTLTFIGLFLRHPRMEVKNNLFCVPMTFNSFDAAQES